MNDTVRYILIGVITPVWVVNLFAPFFVETYKPDLSVNGVFMIVVGFLFGSPALSKLRGRNGNESNSEPPRKGGRE